MKFCFSFFVALWVFTPFVSYSNPVFESIPTLGDRRVDAYRAVLVDVEKELRSTFAILSTGDGGVAWLHEVLLKCAPGDIDSCLGRPEIRSKWESYRKFLEQYDKYLFFKSVYFMARSKLQIDAAIERLPISLRNRLKPQIAKIQQTHAAFLQAVSRYGNNLSDALRREDHLRLMPIRRFYQAITALNVALEGERTKGTETPLRRISKTIADVMSFLFTQGPAYLDLVLRMMTGGDVYGAAMEISDFQARTNWKLSLDIQNPEKLPHSDVFQDFTVTTPAGKTRADVAFIMPDHHQGNLDAWVVATLMDRLGTDRSAVVTSLYYWLKNRLFHPKVEELVGDVLATNEQFLVVLGKPTESLKNLPAPYYAKQKLMETVRDRGRQFILLLPQGNLSSGLGDGQRSPANASPFLPWMLSREKKTDGSPYRVSIVPVAMTHNECFGNQLGMLTHAGSKLGVVVGDPWHPRVVELLMASKKFRADAFQIFWRMWQIEQAARVHKNSVAGSLSVADLEKVADRFTRSDCAASLSEYERTTTSTAPTL